MFKRKNQAELDSLLIKAAEDNDLIAAMKLLDRGANIHFIHPHAGWNAVHFAVSNGHREMVAFLAKKGADINLVDVNGATPMNWAQDGRHYEVMYVLARAGAVTERRDNIGRTPVHTAIVGMPGRANLGNMTLEALLNNGADPNDEDSKGQTPLVLALAWENSEAVRMLINAGADVNHASSKDGTTPLHAAAMEGDEEMLRLLMAHGADIKAPNHNGETPHDIAVQKKKADAFDAAYSQNHARRVRKLRSLSNRNSPLL